jgi:hypothetical protein
LLLLLLVSPLCSVSVLHHFTDVRFALPSWCAVCSGLITPFAASHVCTHCGLHVHAECSVGLPALCTPVPGSIATTAGTASASATATTANNAATPSKVRKSKGKKGSAPSSGASVPAPTPTLIDNVIQFPAASKPFFALGSLRVDCWICRARLAQLRATFPDNTYVLACARCMDAVRRNYAALDAELAAHAPTQPASPLAPPSTTKKAKKKAPTPSTATAPARPLTPASPAPGAPPPTPAVQTPHVRPPHAAAPAPKTSLKAAYPSTPPQPIEPKRTAKSTGATKKRLALVEPTPAPAKAARAPKTVAAAAKSPSADSNDDNAPDDVSREALQYCDAGQRVFESDAKEAVNHFQRAANAQAAELFSRDAPPSERARRVLAVCHANVSAARLALGDAQAALDAAAHAIAADSSWSRPFYRQAKALMALNRPADACSTLVLARRRFTDDESLQTLHRQARKERLELNGVHESDTEEDDDDNNADDDNDDDVDVNENKANTKAPAPAPQSTAKPSQAQPKQQTPKQQPPPPTKADDVDEESESDDESSAYGNEVMAKEEEEEEEEEDSGEEDEATSEE